MRIGIDIDGVLTDIEQWQLDVGGKFFSKYNKTVVNKDKYEIKEIFNISEELDDEFWNEYLYEYATKEPARKYASEVIKKLKEDGHEIYIITGRYKSAEDSETGSIMRNKIKNWLQNNNIVYDELVCTTAPKIPDIKSRKIDVMIEDSPTTIPLISEVTHVLCYDTRYNRDLQCHNMTRVFSWYDIYMKINERKN